MLQTLENMAHLGLRRRPGIPAVALLSVLLVLVSAAGLRAELSRPDEIVDSGSKNKDSVRIYLDFTGASLGRSPYRQLLFSLELPALKYYRSYPVAEPTGWSTAVFVSSETEKKLRLGQLPISAHIKGRGGIYLLDYKGIRIGFGLEVPPKAVFDLIAKTYENLPEVGHTVKERYRSGYTIRIYEAENVLEPENQLVSYPEAILAAAILGDKEQWFWGIHDARDLLNKPMNSSK
ncbi:hypothetical protein P0082_11905 [Candidatus Haliotispira prima]|uniref:Uncharacterized protein n=1 Tax=Candidatus Haliotispira prima TaxID=3034016 RepID=A0ABY8MGS1_9SPIO|nr:hypothetical protein P0082_11905 [Candidatus Haliotispira prima]